MLVKLFALFNWGDTWVEQDSAARLRGCLHRCCGKSSGKSSGKPSAQSGYTVAAAASSRRVTGPSPAAAASVNHSKSDCASRSSTNAAPPMMNLTETAGAAFSHRDPHGNWVPYAREQAAAIYTAMAHQPAAGSVGLLGTPFVVYWGSHAASQAAQVGMAAPTGLLQVNARSGNARLVRRDQQVSVDIERA